MSDRARFACLLACLVCASGCASTRGMQVSRVTRATPADTSRWHDAAVLPQRAPAATLQPPAETSRTPARASKAAASRAASAPVAREAAKTPAPVAAPVATADTSVTPDVSQPLSVEPAEAPAQRTGDDPFDSVFTDPGRVVDLDDTSRDAPAPAPPRADTTTAIQTPPRVRAPVVAPRDTARDADDAEPAARAFAVQLHAFPTRVAAEFAARQAARTLGVETRVREQPSSSLPFKVIAGHYATRGAATDLRERAVRQGFPEAWVVADTEASPH